ncbi:MAG: diguanylate cyclase/phosphodiesterase with sensor(s) [Pseudoduganella sp.]|nr:diguanylate cyclase/phosphodiesterase with sensor(s) [Pseudoduganella sp.]
MFNSAPGWPRTLAANVLLLTVYAVVGRFCLYLSLAPGYASPLFLPAGIALAAVVTFGARLLPGVALGALLINFLPLPGAPNPLSLPPLPQGVAALAAAAGSALQAWLGMLYFRRAIRPEIGAGRDVLRFLLLAVTVTLVSCTLSNGVAVASGALAPERWLTSWLTWWIGDAIGVLLAAPLCWVLFGRPRSLWSRRRLLVGVPQLLLVTLCVLLYVLVARWETRQHLEGFRLKAQQVGDLLQARFSEHERYLLAMARAINRYGRVMSASGFDKIAHGYLDQRPELLSMAWLRPVDAAERPAFDAWAREKLGPDFRIVAPPTSPTHSHSHGPQGQAEVAPGEHMVTLFIEPAERRHYQGLDWLAEPVRAQAVRAALRSGKPVASAPVLLSQPGEGSGVVLLQAVEPGNGEPAAGMLMLAMQIDSYVRGALAGADFPHMQARLVDRSQPGPTLLADVMTRAPQRDDYWRTLSFGGREYELVLAPSPAYMAQQHGWQSWLVLSAGLLLTGLLGALMLLTSGERAQIQQQVKESTARLREREARLQAILDKAADAILTIGSDGLLVSANAAAGRLFGYAPDALAGMPLASLLPEAESDSAARLLRNIAGGATHEHESSARRLDGSVFPIAISVSEVELPDGNLFVAILHDLTEQQRAQERIYRLAHHDPLTGLDNRLSLNLRLDQLLAQTRRAQGTAAVMFLDLDHFKKINDTHGHASGDQLLVAVADRLRDLLREVDTIARLGGDEFIVVTSGSVTPADATHIALRIVHALAEPFQLEGKTIHTGTSVGVAMFPQDGADSAALLRHADTAMYAAKSQGRGNFQFFEAAMNAATHERLMLENRLWQALERKEFELYLQPQVELASRRVIGAEVLLRWHHPELGMVGPDRFIPIAEEAGMILPLGEWVLQEAVGLLRRWQNRLRLAVNLSARQCHGSALLPLLDRLVAESGIDPALLELEITESAAMQDPERSRTLLRELRARGFTVAIDDFGTGYSSLSYLKLFEIDRIKIDRGFVKDIESDPNDAVIVTATIGLAHSLGLGVVAEGVETEAQVEFLRSKFCNEAQGYLFARPMPVAQFEALAGHLPQTA